MAKQFEKLDEKHKTFIKQQKIFFTASATAGSQVNVSPREIGALRLISDTSVMYLDRTGSGNETAAHMLADGRLTIMFCAVEGPPQIMRLYGQGRMINWSSDEFEKIIEQHFQGTLPLGTRQLCKLEIEMVQTSCGYGVPLFDYKGERAAIENWHDNKGVEGIQTYWEENNMESLDGLPTGLLKK